MSRSSPTLSNPASRFFEYKSQAGILQYYDKDKQERVTVPLPMEFLVLDQLNTITGYERSQKASYYSNEVRNSAKEEFVIKLKGAHVVTTLYKNEHGVVQVPKAAKYAKSIYVAYLEDGEWLIGNIRLSGSAMTAWIDFNGKHKVENGKVIMAKGAKVAGEQGDYYPPEFTYTSATPEEDSTAITLDKALQIYLTQYLIAKPEDNEANDDSDVATAEQVEKLKQATKATPEQIADFQEKAAKLADKRENEEIKETVDELFNDEPLPEWRG